VPGSSPEECWVAWVSAAFSQGDAGVLWHREHRLGLGGQGHDGLLRGKSGGERMLLLP